MSVKETRTLPPTSEGVDAAAKILRAGGLVAFPTETVYGLGADASDGRAVAGIFDAKGRPRFNPLIAHVADRASAERLVSLPDPLALLAEAFWPGPLTLVAPRRASGVDDLCTAGLDTLGVRVPDLPLARDLLRAVGGPVAAPSANRSGGVSPTAAEHVLAELDGRIDAVLDGGACRVGLESTIVGLVDDEARLFREGGVSAEDLANVLGAAPRGVTVSGAPMSPGQLASHYAPGARLRLNATGPSDDEAWLGFGPDSQGASHDGAGGMALTLSASGDLVEAAANLFAHLRTLDRRLDGAGVIAVAPVPEIGLGRAINDRLRRAAAPRD